MLIVFNLDWKACDIDQKVTQASRNLNTLVEAMGVGPYVQYDLTSLGAGELVFWKSAPPEKRNNLQNNLDFLRQQHLLACKDLEEDAAFKKFRQTGELLNVLRRNRHTLAVVFNGEAAECDEMLRRARLREFFETRLYGVDSVNKQPAGLCDLYAEAVSRNKLSLNDVKVRCSDDDVQLAVDDTLEGAKAGKISKIPVAGYVSVDNCPDKEARIRGEKMVEAGADYLVATPHEIINLLVRVSARQMVLGKKVPPGLPSGMPVLNFSNPSSPAP